MMTVPLYGKRAAGRVALIDDADLDLVSPYRWYAWVQERTGHDSGPYAVAYLLADGRRKTLRMHKLITGHERTDHWNGDGLDNQRSNLRAVTNSQNLANSRSRRGTSTFKGVCWDRERGKWQAQITAAGRHRQIGRFDSEEAAARAYDAAARLAFGEYAHLNFP